jgi:hypothetical protein
MLLVVLINTCFSSFPPSWKEEIACGHIHITVNKVKTEAAIFFGEGALGDIFSI